MADVREGKAATAVQPEVQKYLEAVFAVAPFPEEYVRYRLHLATALPLPLIDAWFEERRQAAVGAGPRPDGGAPAAAPDAGEQARANGHQNGAAAAAAAADFPAAAEALGGRQSSAGREAPPGNGVAPSQGPSGGGRSGRPRASAAAAEGDNARFTEADLDAVSQLVGLDRITSTQAHCGSHSLYLFEQLTALDSLDFKGAGSKRRRTRHQHFWRNTDKLDAKERVYVPCASLGPAIKRREPVAPKAEIGLEERSNAWTVCLTTRGVVSYLNKRISPLGVRMIRALQREGGGGGGGGSAWDRGGSCSADEPDEESQSPRAAAGRDAPGDGGSSSGGEAGEGGAAAAAEWERSQHLAAANTLGTFTAGAAAAEGDAFVPYAPRARRRKPG